MRFTRLFPLDEMVVDRWPLGVEMAGMMHKIEDDLELVRTLRQKITQAIPTGNGLSRGDREVSLQVGRVPRVLQDRHPMSRIKGSSTRLAVLTRNRAATKCLREAGSVPAQIRSQTRHF